MLLLSGSLAKWTRHKHHTDPGWFRVAYYRYRRVMCVGLLLRSVHYWFRLCVHSALRCCAGRAGGNHQDLGSPDATQEERARTPIRAPPAPLALRRMRSGFATARVYDKHLRGGVLLLKGQNTTLFSQLCDILAHVYPRYACGEMA